VTIYVPTNVGEYCFESNSKVTTCIRFDSNFQIFVVKVVITLYTLCSTITCLKISFTVQCGDLDTANSGCTSKDSSISKCGVSGSC